MTNSFEVISNGLRSIIKCTHFLYVKLWSDYATWHGEVPPIEGQNVSIANSNILVDCNLNSINNIVLTNSRLMFTDNADLLISVKSITINKGAFIIGSE
jgi:hypothetical protein